MKSIINLAWMTSFLLSLPTITSVRAHGALECFSKTCNDPSWWGTIFMSSIENCIKHCQQTPGRHNRRTTHFGVHCPRESGIFCTCGSGIPMNDACFVHMRHCDGRSGWSPCPNSTTDYTKLQDALTNEVDQYALGSDAYMAIHEMPLPNEMSKITKCTGPQTTTINERNGNDIVIKQTVTTKHKHSKIFVETQTMWNEDGSKMIRFKETVFDQQRNVMKQREIVYKRDGTKEITAILFHDDESTTTTIQKVNERGQVIEETVTKRNIAETVIQKICTNFGEDGSRWIRNETMHKGGAMTTTTKEVDPMGKITKEGVAEIDADGTLSVRKKSVYDENGRKVITKSIYDSDGNVVQETVTWKEVGGNTTRVTDTIFKHTQTNEVTKEIEEVNKVRNTLHYKDGTKTEVKHDEDARGRETSKTVQNFDAGGNVVDTNSGGFGWFRAGIWCGAVAAIFGTLNKLVDSVVKMFGPLWNRLRYRWRRRNVANEPDTTSVYSADTTTSHLFRGENKGNCSESDDEEKQMSTRSTR